MSKIKVYTKKRGVRILKEGITLKMYRAKYPDAVIVPSISKLEGWMNEGVCRALDGCYVEQDGICEHGSLSWLLKLGMI